VTQVHERPISVAIVAQVVCMRASLRDRPDAPEAIWRAAG